jgi:hypothetical protein
MTSAFGVLFLLAIEALAVGCGGSGSGDGGVASTAATTTNTRLTAEQWDAYGRSRTSLTSATPMASATLTSCSAKAQDRQADAWQACVGTSFSDLSRAAAGSRATLQSFSGTVSGACADSLSALVNYVGTYEAAANAMQRVADSASLASYPAVSSDLVTAFDTGKTEAKSFDVNCAPA